jgi:steroid delta-isomerase-like uncharacterized protein
VSGSSLATTEEDTMTLDANKALIRHVFEKVIPAGDAAAMRELVAPGWIDHDPLPGQPVGVEGAEYVVSTMHGAHPDLRFSIDDLIAEGDRVTIRWTLRGTNTGPMVGRPPTGKPVELAAIVIFRITDGRIAERWAGWKPGRAPVPDGGICTGGYDQATWDPAGQRDSTELLKTKPFVKYDPGQRNGSARRH